MKRIITMGLILTAALCLVFLVWTRSARQMAALQSSSQNQEETDHSTEAGRESGREPDGKSPEEENRESDGESRKEEETAVSEEDLKAAESVVENERISIFEGMIGPQKIRLSIYRKDDQLTASYVKRNEEENEIKLEGTINTKTTSFQLNNEEKGISIMGRILPATAEGDVLEGAYTSPESATGFKFLVSLAYGMTASPDAPYSMVTGSTADEVEAFAGKIKKYILEDNKKDLAGLISYPITVTMDGTVTAINTAEEFEKNYDKIITAEFRSRIADTYTKYLFTNYMGIMMENGALWFSDGNGGAGLKIISINND
ncbi:hypothetical protein AALB39_11245 [Lachnospiraceae bacterium 54-53]